ncbi:MAG: hypothetical protein ABSF28_09715 [Terracidiphilus sp.]|jgi:hypothetical protein
MPHGFDTYRVFISAPGDLETDRQACYNVIAHVNETTAMAAKVLLVSVGLQDNSQISGSRSIVSENVRWSTYFIQIFEDDWGARDLFRKLFLLAVECRDDASMPMRDAVVCLKDAPHETNAEILAFRKELEERQDLRVFRYGGVDELTEQLTAVCTGWARDLVGLGISREAAAGASS